MTDKIDSLCMTWRHDYGLHKADDADPLWCGMTTSQRGALRRQMAQIHAHHIAPLEEANRLLHEQLDTARETIGAMRASQPGGGEAEAAGDGIFAPWEGDK